MAKVALIVKNLLLGNSPTRALEYARELHLRPRKSGSNVKKPAVVGAIIVLGYCRNLLDNT